MDGLPRHQVHEVVLSAVAGQQGEVEPLLAGSQESWVLQCHDHFWVEDLDLCIDKCSIIKCPQYKTGALSIDVMVLREAVL